MIWMLRVLAVVALATLSACASGLGIVGDPAQQSRPVDVTQLPSMRVVAVNVEVPRSLTVSEANTYKPRADIVWREDPFGDRYEQVKLIFEEGVGRGARELQGDLPVVVHVIVRKFHALTERTRYSYGGTHAIDFHLAVTNARTGEVIIPPYLVRTSLRAYGGEEAIAAERQGITQKVRITAHLAELIKQELTGVPATPAS